MTDLELCKRIAEIKCINYTTGVNTKLYPARNAIYYRKYEGTRPAPLADKKLREFNPLTDKALCFELMVEYKVDMVFTDSTTIARIYDDPEDEPIGVCKDPDPQRAILMAIIKSKELNHE